VQLTIVVLAALAAAPNRAERCEALWTSFTEDVQLKANVLKALTGKPSVDKAHERFVKDCMELRQECVDYGSQAGGTAKFEDCPILKGVLEEAVYRPGLVSAGDLDAFRRRMGEREVKYYLMDLGRSVRAYEGSRGTLTLSAGPTPKADCCKLGGTCRTALEDWSEEGWSALAFAPPLPIRFHYSMKADEKKRSVLFRAVGDPTCTGQKETWELSVKPGRDGQLEIGAPRKVQ
jgi:hypothetical protein